jgi:dihydrofolate synthase/folylpolyglutamate synthase
VPPRPRERLVALEHFGIKLGLDNITHLIEALGRPDRSYPTIHIAGTNGKGSVTAMVERGLRAAGQITGRYTSPHLVDIEERVAINGSAIDAATFDEATTAVLECVDGLRERGVLPHPPTFFEVTTAIAFEVFRRRHVTAAVIEVGLGGRFDATNVIAPAITAITSIALDHERHLGRTLKDIAFEKAGIVKRDVPLVLGPMLSGPRSVIERIARERGAPVVDATPALPGTGTAVSLALHGRHQHDNASVAVEVLKVCAQRGLGVRHDDIVTALSDVEWPARLEWLRLPPGGDILIDAAHNPAGAHALAEYVLETTGALPLVFGVMKDKDVDAIVRALAPAVSRVITTAVDSPRAMESSALAERIRSLVPGVDVASARDPMQAVNECLREGRLVVAGSIFLVGPVRAQLLARQAAPVRYPSKAGPFFLT